ncbi:hypothetical protein RclHR1_13290013 [Rhizophagus clarus]|uniref:Uncharacterized protein n=1 Tax=Rhizophagus clarus TaxID=94130 RepID=A0A2Z6QBF4_9GLOM|nr:hypothetical protein RclHR1_13290013 [Rhizophagus clarus]
MRGALALVLLIRKSICGIELLTMCEPRRDSNFYSILMARARDIKRHIVLYNTNEYFMRQFDDAFEGVCSLHDIKMAVKSLTDDEIKKNMKNLKKKLARSECAHAEEIRQNLEDISISDLTWRDPIASQVIDDDSVIVKNLDRYARLKLCMSQLKSSYSLAWRGLKKKILA